MQTRMLGAIVGVATIGGIGCGDDSGKGGEPTEVTLHAYGAKLLAIQPAGGDWRQLEVPADGDVVTEVASAYTVAIVCDQPGFFDYYVVHAGPDDLELDLWCDRKPEVQLARVTLAADSTAEPYILGIPLGSISEWEFEHGTYDIVAYDRSLATPRYEIQRDFVIDRDVELAFDLAANGMDLEPYSITTNADPLESVVTSTRLVTANNTRARFGALPGDARMWRVPRAQLAATDRQLAVASAFEDTTFTERATRRLIDGESQVTLALPDAAVVSSTWSGTPRVSFSAGDYDDVYFYAANEDFSRLVDIHVRPSWTAEMGASTELGFPDPATLPGWQAAWNLASPTGWTWFFSAERAVSAYESDWTTSEGTY